MTNSKPPSDQIDVVCAPSLPILDALAAERLPLILDLRERRDRALGRAQPAYIWLRPMDDGESEPSGAMIRFAVGTEGIWDWDGRRRGRVVFLADDRVYTERVVAAMRDVASATCRH